MTLTPTFRLRPALLFGLLALAVAGGELLVVRRPDFAAHPALPAAVTFDLLAVLPLLFYLLVVRPYRLPVTTVAGAFAGAVALAYWVLPVPQQLYLAWTRPALAGIEVLTVTVALLNLRRLRQAYRAAQLEGPDVVANLTAALERVLGRAGTLLVAEVSVLYYALLSWRATPEAATPDRAFSNYHESAFTAYLGTVGLLSVAEMGAAHVLLMRWSHPAALVALLLHLYGLLLLLAHGRAVRLRPTLLTETGVLVVRVGFLWSLRLPAAAVAGCELLPNEAPAAEPGLLNTARALLTPPNMLLTLAQDFPATGPYGIRRQVRQVALYLDAPAEFRAALLDTRQGAASPVFGNKP